LHRILVHLLFAPEDEDEDMDSDDAPSTSKRGPLVRSTPYHRYHTLPPADKIAILCFMVNVATSSKAVHAHIEASEEQLTTLRKEKIELGRAKKAQ
jgi:bromodomain adjacent to zinc finger domain protein 1A